MGYNSTLIILNDSLHEIESDKDFGKKVHDAVLEVNRGKPVTIRSGSHVNAATVVESHHADFMRILAVGGNSASDLGYGGSYRATPEEILKHLAEQLGYRLVKMPTKKKLI